MIHFFKLLLLIQIILIINGINLLDISIDGLPNKIYLNASKGLEPETFTNSQCKWDKNGKRFKGGGYDMSYTPNRRLQKDTIADSILNRIQLGIVLVVGGHTGDHGKYDYGPSGSVNGLMAVWDSWVENFFAYTSNTTSLVLLFDERDYKKQNYTKSTHDYLDRIVIDNMNAQPVDCIHIRARPHGYNTDMIYKHHTQKYLHRSHVNSNHPSKHHTNIISVDEEHLQPNPYARRTSVAQENSHNNIHSNNHHIKNNLKLGSRHSKQSQHSHIYGRDHGYVGGCNNYLPIDSGYRVYYVDVAALYSNNTYQQPFIIFAAVHKFLPPEWARNSNEEELFQNWKPWRLPGRYPTNYAYVKMTNWYSYYMLNLKILDFFDYGGKLDNDVSFIKPFPESNLPLRLALKNTKMLVTQNGWYYDDPRVAQGVYQCLESFIKEQSKECQWKSLHPTGRSDPTFWESNLNATFRAHFLIYWLGIYTAPETKLLAKYWNDWHPRGQWDYRWGDQQWWPRPISMFGNGNITEEIDHYDEINTDNEKYVIHKLWPRAGTISKAMYYNINGSTKQDRDKVYKIASKPFIY